MAVLALPRAAHPEPVAAVTVATTLLAIAVGHRWPGTAIVAATVAASLLAVGWHNDWLDADRDAAVGRTDKPVAAGLVARRTVLIAATAAAALTVPLALLAGAPAAGVAVLGLGCGLLYNWPLKFTAASVVPYVIAFAALPSFVVLALPGAPIPPLWMMLAGLLIGAGAHFANAVSDFDDDARTGVRGLPHRIGAAASRATAAVLLLAATVMLAVGPPGPPSWPGITAIILAAAVLPLGWYGSRRELRRGARPAAAFRAVLVVALIDVVLLVASGRLV